MSSEEAFATAYGGFYPGAGRLYPEFDSCLSMVVRGLVDMNHQTRHLRTIEFIYGRSKNVGPIPGQLHNALTNWPQDCSLAGRSS